VNLIPRMSRETQVFKNRKVREIFGFKVEEVRQRRRKLHMDAIRNVYFYREILLG
jgi:hypothetical protein